MTNENMMEEVMYKAHYEGIVERVQKRAQELRTKEGKDFYNSYIEAYDDVKKVDKKGSL